MRVVGRRVGRRYAAADVHDVIRQHAAEILVVAHDADDRRGVVVQRCEDRLIAVGPRRREVLQRDAIEGTRMSLRWIHDDIAPCPRARSRCTRAVSVSSSAGVGGVPVSRSNMRFACARSPALGVLLPGCERDDGECQRDGLCERCARCRFPSAVHGLLAAHVAARITLPFESRAPFAKERIYSPPSSDSAAANIRSLEKSQVTVSSPRRRAAGDSTEPFARACRLAATMRVAFNVRGLTGKCERYHALGACNSRTMHEIRVRHSRSVTRLTDRGICRVEDCASLSPRIVRCQSCMSTRARIAGKP